MLVLGGVRLEHSCKLAVWHRCTAGMPEDNVKVYSHTANNTGRLLIDQT